MVCVKEIRKPQQTEGPATIMAIGTASPANIVYQNTYPDYYFRVTNSEHMTELKEKFKRMCEKSKIRKRHMHLTEELLKENPSICEYMAPSLDARQNMVVDEVPKLGKVAATRAIKEWGQPKSKITHLVFCTTIPINLPGVDYHFTKLIGLSPSVKRLMMCEQGCFGGGMALRLAKDLAETNKGARVLVVCSDIGSATTFRGPCETHLNNLVCHALFGDGAAAVIVGSDPIIGLEKPFFEMVSAAQTIIPNSTYAIEGRLIEVGFMVNLLREIPGLISSHIEESLIEAFSPLGISDWNSIFWACHPGGPAILSQIEQTLGLKKEKLEVSWHVLSEYGNMFSPCVLFILNEMRKRSAKC